MKKTKTKKEGNKIKKKPRLKNNSRAGFQKNSSKKNSSNNSKGKYCKTSDCFILSKNISTGVGLIVILTTVLVLGCLVLSYEIKNRDYISKVKNERKYTKEKISTSSLNSKYEIGNKKETSKVNFSSVNPGWLRYTSNKKPVSSTNNWESFSLTNKRTSFSIEYPESWRLEDGIFRDKNNKKIGELSPGVITLKPGQKCFHSEVRESKFRQLLIQKEIEIKNKTGILRVMKVMRDPVNDHWYPHIYCIMKKNKAFVITFYEEESGSSSKNKELFKKIISTLNFD